MAILLGPPATLLLLLGKVVYVPTAAPCHHFSCRMCGASIVRRPVHEQLDTRARPQFACPSRAPESQAVKPPAVEAARIAPNARPKRHLHSADMQSPAKNRKSAKKIKLVTSQSPQPAMPTQERPGCQNRPLIWISRELNVRDWAIAAGPPSGSAALSSQATHGVVSCHSGVRSTNDPS